MQDLFYDEATDAGAGVIDFLAGMLEGADLYFAKILSRNDCSWADDSSKHQGGIYIPESIRRSGFFPAFIQRSDKPHIYEVTFETIWPVSKETRTTRFVHYSNKGPEAHITGVVKSEFSGIGPASLFVCTRKPGSAGVPEYHCMVIDSSTTDYDLAFDYLELPPEFISWVREVKKKLDDIEQLIQELLEAVETNRLDTFIRSAQLPGTLAMSKHARERYAEAHGINGFNPFAIKRPGDVIAGIIEFEYEDFKKRELRLRVAQIANALVRRNIHSGNTKAIISAIVTGFNDVSDIFKSIRGSRATRAGTSFELHIKTMLEGGRIPHQYQALIGRKSPDFILPSMSFYNISTREPGDAIILTAKTTLRERWQQILNEGKNIGFWHLATLDKTVTNESLDEMEELGVVLVVPETLKDATYTLYADRKMVISFSDFFTNEVSPKLGLWE